MPAALLAQFDQRPHTSLVRVDEAIPGILIDLRYATDRNIVGRPFYQSGVAWLRPEACERLTLVQRKIHRHGLQLVVWDAWRPPTAQRILWQAFPNPSFVANPNKGSRHSRGTTVDLGLADLKGNLVPMPSDHDVFTDEADHDFSDLPADRRRNGEILRNAMFDSGFSGVPGEWWHYDLRNWREFPNIPDP